MEQFYQIGAENSWLLAAWEKNIPIYSPGWEDSTTGNMFAAGVLRGAVLLPTFGCRQDDAARAILADCFPGRRVLPVDCRVLIAGLGALHCLTQQVPAVP
jgi:hypothetical protein